LGGGALGGYLLDMSGMACTAETGGGSVAGPNVAGREGAGVLRRCIVR